MVLQHKQLSIRQYGAFQEGNAPYCARRVANNVGAPIVRRAYGTYGETTLTQMTQGRGHPFGYTGRRWNPDLNLYYYRARWYDPTLGTFLETDPIGSLDYVNLYSYVGAEPGNKTDPTGMADVNLTSAHDPWDIARAGFAFDLPGVVTVVGHGAPLQMRTGPRKYSEILTDTVTQQISRAGPSSQPIAIFACRMGTNQGGIRQASQISSSLGNRPVMTATSQIWFAVDRNGVISAQAFWKDKDGKPAAPGQFVVTNGSFADYGIQVPQGSTVQGFRFNPNTGALSVIFRQSTTTTSAAAGQVSRPK